MKRRYRRTIHPGGGCSSRTSGGREAPKNSAGGAGRGDASRFEGRALAAAASAGRARFGGGGSSSASAAASRCKAATTSASSSFFIVPSANSTSQVREPGECWYSTVAVTPSSVVNFKPTRSVLDMLPAHTTLHLAQQFDKKDVHHV